MPILVNAECHLPNLEQPLVGGRDFLESLVNAVSNYTQELLSGIGHPKTQKAQPDLVRLEPGPQADLHTLTLQPEGENTNGRSPTQVNLTTVQLFDLLEAVDQFLADSRTLPDVSLNLKSVPKQYAATHQSVGERVAPAVLGVTGLALAGAALFAIPIPKKVEPPKIPQPQAQTQASPVPQPPTTTGSPAANPTSATAASPATSQAPATLTSITDPTVVKSLQQQTQKQLETAWTNKNEFTKDVVYRVSVNKGGKIVGYKSIGQAAPNPSALQKLVAAPAAGNNPEAIAEFKVVFKPNGQVDVSPWK
jgi:cytoskeletal protein RodZ